MADPSDYELRAWRDIESVKSRPLSRAMRNAGERAATGVDRVGNRAARYLEKHPRAQSAIERGQEAAAKGGDAVSAGVRRAAEGLPDWSETAYGSLRRTVGRISRVGLSPSAVVAKRGSAATMSCPSPIFAASTSSRLTPFEVEDRAGTTQLPPRFRERVPD